MEGDLSIIIYCLKNVVNVRGIMKSFGIHVNLITFFYIPEVAERDAEEGEIIAQGSRDKYDINKIISYPGFNVPCSPDTIDVSISDVVCFGYFA
jgi:hypothetical protein